MDYTALKTPGVYIDEIPKLPPSIASVETAIPAFIGYTEKTPDDLVIEPGAKIKRPLKIRSIFEYELYYGQTVKEDDITITIDMSKPSNPSQVTKKVNKPKYLMYYSLQMFFDNGGGECYIVSVGDLSKGTIMESDLQTGLDEIKKLRDVTLIVFPDAINMSETDYYAIHNAAILQCVLMKDRFTVFDVWIDDANPLTDNIAALRSANLPIGSDLKYAAVYYPRIYADINYLIDETKATLTVTNDAGGKNYSGNLSGAVKGANNYYWMAKSAIDNFTMLMPVSSAAVGLYAYVDSNRGVWKAPANVAITSAIKPEVAITNEQQETMNVDPQDGKSVNVVRTFPGRGPAIVWGARTLAGNDNEWRYIPVRRLFIMVETSVKNATQQFVFEPNDENTWVRVRSMIENYLTQLWKGGALMGASAKEAFYVHVGLGQTMTEVDIWEGRMIIQIGLAAVRPAEFIILQFMHKMLSES
jgi:hypothetical protein